MFTGIVEEAGKVAQIIRNELGIRLELRAGGIAEGTQIGDSVAVNGCCLTVVGIDREKTTLAFDLLRETWERTNFSEMSVESAVNLERSLRADGRLHGHFVTGHIDGTGQILTLEMRGADWLLEVSFPAALRNQLVQKGSIALDGISLTLAEVIEDRFRVWIIPHTYAVTALRERKVGSLVNLEGDLLAKYVARLMENPDPEPSRG